MTDHFFRCEISARSAWLSQRLFLKGPWTFTKKPVTAVQANHGFRGSGRLWIEEPVQTPK